MQASSTKSSPRLGIARRLGVLGLAAVACLGLRGDRRAEACTGLGYTIVDLTTFDPTILPDTWDGLNFDPLHVSFGGACTDDCAKAAIVKDWHDYLAGAITDADWEKILFNASTNELAGLTSRLAGKSTPVPPGYETSSLWKATGPA